MSDASAVDGTVPAVQSFEQLYRGEFPAVVALAYVLSGSRTAAEDLAQESFLAAHRRWDAIRDYENVSAWVRRVCINRSTSLVRRRVSEAKALARLPNGKSVGPVPVIQAEGGPFYRVEVPNPQGPLTVIGYRDAGAPVRYTVPA